MKIAARLTNFKGCFGLIWHFTYPSPTTLPEPALWATYEFLNEHTTIINFRGDSCVNSRLKTILIHTGVAPKIDYSSVFIQKFICSPKCRFRECSWRGIGKMPDQPKTPLKVGQSGCNFHRKLNLYQRMILYRAGLLEGNFRNFNFRGVGGPMSPLRWKMSSIL